MAESTSPAASRYSANSLLRRFRLSNATTVLSEFSRLNDKAITWYRLESR
jgi:hypothetical protein